MKEEDTIYLFENIEMPLAKVLAKMEIEGIWVWREEEYMNY